MSLTLKTPYKTLYVYVGQTPRSHYKYAKKKYIKIRYKMGRK